MGLLMQEEIEKIMKVAHQEQGYSLWDIKKILEGILKDVDYEIQKTKVNTSDLSEEQDKELDELMFHKSCENTKCCICGINGVNTANGFDTCSECLSKI
jgi:hypothetical protein